MKYSNALAAAGFLAIFYPVAAKARVITDNSLITREAVNNTSNTLTVATIDAGAPISTSGKAKRAPMLYSRIINTCPSFYTYMTSFCTRRTGQDYVTRCVEDDDLSYSTQDFAGKCADTELCIDGIHSPDHPLVAYCVSTNNFVQIASGQYGAGQRLGVRINLADKTTTGDAIEVVLAGAGGITTAYKASHLQLEARDASDATLPAGLNQCDGCTSIGIEPWPTGTDTFYATVEMAGAGDTAFLYEALVVPGSGW